MPPGRKAASHSPNKDPHDDHPPTTSATVSDAGTIPNLGGTTLTGPDPPGTTQLPIARVKRIIKEDKEVSLINAEATFLVAVATELFMEYLVSEGFSRARRDKRKTVYYRDLGTCPSLCQIFCHFEMYSLISTDEFSRLSLLRLPHAHIHIYARLFSVSLSPIDDTSKTKTASVVDEIDQFEFLEDVIPKTMPLKKALERRKEALEEEEHSGSAGAGGSHADHNGHNDDDDAGEGSSRSLSAAAAIAKAYSRRSEPEDEGEDEEMGDA
ncbi:histone-like transcription factor (CBF/NF-Y) and archaeal histone-domain-containing protein [Jimgerdemannia flammicorona]|uniref:Histone-like transcription factor (CBF/NF-Y) and archaeal histone-domain-containing protein n=1 Tax=Jimgerdemannia flammicorona TaxID=994334 RepID=A0A433D4P6_9FUNG|nr:histone-like transcription factor (CBF/NF-Y) and archaeal histone-domain-containing protein [Jimgerdemannia flammicorona]